MLQLWPYIHTMHSPYSLAASNFIIVMASMPTFGSRLHIYSFLPFRALRSERRRRWRSSATQNHIYSLHYYIYVHMTRAHMAYNCNLVFFFFQNCSCCFFSRPEQQSTNGPRLADWLGADTLLTRDSIHYVCNICYYYENCGRPKGITNDAHCCLVQAKCTKNQSHLHIFNSNKFLMFFFKFMHLRLGKSRPQ